MKTKFLLLLLMLWALLGLNRSAAQGSRFFRISGPTAATITGFRPDGTLIWNNALPGSNYIVQTISSLAGGTDWVDYAQLPAFNGLCTNRLVSFTPPPGMTLIPAGVFTMGDSLDAESDAPLTNVMESDFYMDINLVSSSQWLPVYSWATNHGYGFEHFVSGGTNNPEIVIWFDALKWCNARSQLAGLKPAYYVDGDLSNILTIGERPISVDWRANGYRLPTEAEWEKAARGGLRGQRFPWGNTIPQSQAGSYPPNGYGLYDMVGNTFQWCSDLYAAYAGGTDPRGPASENLSGGTDGGTEVVQRGGGFGLGAYQARCAYRTYSQVASYPINQYVGSCAFRCVTYSTLTNSWDNYFPSTNFVNTNLLIDFNPPGTMAAIPAGSFVMGDTLDGESDAQPTNVTVSAFSMDVNLVTCIRWATLYAWATNNGYGFANPGSGEQANYPVENMDWYDAVKWCNARSQQAGVTPVYYTDAGLTLVFTNGETNVYANWSANGYRLATEAEWEKAARGGVSGLRFPWGDTISPTQANYTPLGQPYLPYDLAQYPQDPPFVAFCYPYANPAGYYAPNGYGLYDMAGNMEEWCWDWYGTAYAGGTDPRGPSSGSSRVVRSGCWYDRAITLRCANRLKYNPASIGIYRIGDVVFVDKITGFRCVRNGN